MNEQVIWGIHAGRLGDADSLFLKKTVIAIGWHELGDIGKIGGDRETLKREIAKTYPKVKAGAIPLDSGDIHLISPVYAQVVQDQD